MCYKAHTQSEKLDFLFACVPDMSFHWLFSKHPVSRTSMRVASFFVEGRGLDKLPKQLNRKTSLPLPN